jgi:hypothetical protein
MATRAWKEGGKAAAKSAVVQRHLRVAKQVCSSREATRKGQRYSESVRSRIDLCGFARTVQVAVAQPEVKTGHIPWERICFFYATVDPSMKLKLFPCKFKCDQLISF